MATSGSFSTNQVKAGSRTWYWDFSWSVASWSGNTATINWSAVTRATSGTSGQSYVSNYGFSITVNGSTQTSSSSFYKDNTIASGSFTLGGGNSFSASITAHPYGGSYTSSGNSSWTLDNNVVKPSVTCSIASTSETTVTLTGTVTNNGNAAITASGYEKSTDNSTWTTCTNSVTGLNTNTKYYFRYWATNSAGRTNSSSVNTTTWKSPALTSIATSALIAGNAQTLTLENPHSRNCSITVKDGNNNTLYTGSTSGTSLTFTIAADKCRTALGSGTSTVTSANLTYTCVYSSWTTTKTGTLGINTTYKPTWSSSFAINTAITYADTNTTTIGITGSNQILVQGKSSWEYSLALTGNQAAVANSNSGSSIKEYKVSTDGGASWTTKSASATHISVGAIGSTTTSVNVKVKAIDYKGLESTIQTRTISVTPYSLPSGTMAAKRQNNYGETVELAINPTWAVGSGNTGTAAWSYKLSTTSSWTTGGTISTFNTPAVLGVVFDNTLSYDFRIILTDAFGGSSTAILASVGPGTPILFIDETVNGVGVNDIPTEQGLFVDGKTNIKGDLKVTNTINNTFNISVGNTNNYPYHRIAYTPVRTGNYIDNSLVLLLTAGYQGGPYGIVKCDLRTNNASGGGTAGASAVWLSRYGFSADQVTLGLKNTAADSYLDVFIKTSGTYNSIVVTPLYMGRRGAFDTSMYTLCNSAEVNNTTTTDPLTSYESYSIISATSSENKGPRTYTNIITAADGGNVNFSNNIQIDTTNPSDQTMYYPTFVTGSGSQRERINNGLLYYSKEGTTSAQGEAFWRVGNGTNSGTAGNKKGYLQLYGQNTGRSQIEYTNSTSNVTQILPALAGTFVVKQSATISTETNGWYKVDMGAFTLYFKNGDTASQSFAANTWSYINMNLPSGITYNDAKMVLFGNAKGRDNAIRVSFAVFSGGTQMQFSWHNVWTGAITTQIRYNVGLIVFP